MPHFQLLHLCQTLTFTVRSETCAVLGGKCRKKVKHCTRHSEVEIPVSGLCTKSKKKKTCCVPGKRRCLICYY